MKGLLTIWRLLHVNNRLEGGTGEGVRLLGGSGLGYLFPEGLGQAALQEVSARLELLVVLRVFRAAVVKDGDYCRRLPSRLLLAQRGPFGACETENTARLDEIYTGC